MRNLGQWFEAYGVSHRHPTNIALHKVCVPAIFWSLIAFLVGLQHPLSLSLLAALIIGSLYFYLRLGWRVFVLMTLAVIACLFTDGFMLSLGWPLWQIAAVVFIVAWIGQFVGHKIEGKKPSFFEDLQFLLVGPLWVIKGLLRRNLIS